MKSIIQIILTKRTQNTLLLRRQLNINASLKPVVSQKKPVVIIIGSGWSGFRMASDLDKDKYEVKVVSPRNHFLFTPLLPSTAVGTLEFRAIQEPIRTIPRIIYYQASVSNISFKNKALHCIDSFKGNTFTLEYDAVIIAPGSETNTFGIKGVYNNVHVFFLKQLQESRKIRKRLIECFERASNPSALLSSQERKRLLTFIVVGGGPTSVEFAAELYDFLKKDVSRYYPESINRDIRITLVEASGHILNSFNVGLVGYVETLFKSRNIEVLTNTAVKEINGHTALLSNGQEISFGLLVWGAGVKQVPLIEQLSGIEKHKNGRICIDSHLRVIQNPSTSSSDTVTITTITGGDIHIAAATESNSKEGAVFALGDCAANINKPLPMLAQVASQQAIYLSAQLNKHGIEDLWTLPTSDTVIHANNNETASSTTSSKVIIPPFLYGHLGAMASVGQWKGVYDSSNIGNKDSYQISGPPVKGFLAFALWRAAYWTKQVSIQNKIFILMYWLKSAVFGRDVSRF